MDTILALDTSILNFIDANLHCAFFDRIFVFFTVLGDFGLVWISAATLMLFSRRYRSCGVVALIALLLSLLLVNYGIKPFIARPRPFNQIPDLTMLIPKPSDFSFPSGHASSSFAAATIFFFFHKKHGTYALLLASLIALSRVYLSVHFPSDILVGAALGFLCGLVAVGFYILLRRLYYKRKLCYKN